MFAYLTNPMLDDILQSRPARSVGDVLSLMNAIDGTLPDSDGLKWFNRLYLRVTEGVDRAVADTTFADPQFMAALDVAFANLYFEAVAEGATRGGDRQRVPPAWRPLFRARNDQRLVRLQFGLAGMNAHINRDLPIGIVQVFESLGGDPRTAVARHGDFDSLNALLERTQADVKPEFAVGVLGTLDVVAGDVDDLAATFKVRLARAAAWTNAEVLWTLQSAPELRDRFLERLDGLTGLAGRGLLIPLPLRHSER